MSDKAIKAKVDEFFELAGRIAETKKWTMDMQNVMDDLATIKSCSESPEAVQKKIDELNELATDMNEVDDA